MARETPRNKKVNALEHDQGIRNRSWWYSSLRVRGGGWSTIISYGVEISIAGGVVEMVRVLSRCSEVSSHISCQQDPVSWRAAKYTVLQTECS